MNLLGFVIIISFQDWLVVYLTYKISLLISNTYWETMDDDEDVLLARGHGSWLCFIKLVKSYKCFALLLYISFLFDTQKCSIHWEGGQRLLTDVSAILPQNSWDIYGARSWATPRASSGRSKSYLASRFPYTANDTSNQQLSRIVLGGNIHKNPGPTEKRTPKYPCKESGKGVRLNQDALLCTECNVWSHAKCMNLSKAGFKYYLDYPDIERTCSLCSLPFRFEQSLVGVENLTQHGGEGEYANEDVAGYANDLPKLWIIQERKRNTTDLMMVHLNINSCQNKLDDLILLNKELKSHVIFLSETKIDSSYTNAQVALEGYHTYGMDRKKGGGGLMAYFSSKMVSHRVKLPKQYKLLEILAINATINNNDVLFVGIYRAPNATGTDYYRKLEEEFNSLCMWATMECNTLILTGDLNLDRLRPERTEGKIFAQSRGGLCIVYCIFWDGRVRTGILDIPGFTGVTGSFLILVSVTGSLLGVI